MTTLREALEGAYVAAVKDEDETDSPPPETPPPETQVASSTEPKAPESTSEVSGSADEAKEAKESQRGDKGRDERGRFVPPAKPQKTVTPTPRAGQQADEKPPGPPQAKAPQSWKPTEREAWAKAPAEVQAAVQRREAEVARALQDSTTARQSHQRWQEATSPFEAMVRSQGGDMYSTVGNLLSTQYALQTAPPAGKAQIVANIISSFGVDPGHVAAFLQGQGAQLQAQSINPDAIAQRAAQTVEQRLQAQAAQRMHTKNLSELEAFESNPQNEFLEDVREDMARLLESGFAKDYSDAYNKALKLNPSVAAALEQRNGAQQATAQRAATQRARTASISLKSTPAGPSGSPQRTDLRGILERAYDERSGRSR